MHKNKLVFLIFSIGIFCINGLNGNTTRSTVGLPDFQATYNQHPKTPSATIFTPFDYESKILGFENKKDSILNIGGQHNAAEVLTDSIKGEKMPMNLKDLNDILTPMVILGELNNNKPLTVLSEYLNNSDNDALISVSGKSIGHIGGAKAFQILSKTVKNSQTNNDIRRVEAAIIGLGYCNDIRAEKVLQSLLNRNVYSNISTRIYIAGALGMYGNQVGYKIAMDGLNSANTDVLLSALSALGFIGNTDALGAVWNIFNSNASYVVKKRCKLTIFMIECQEESKYAEVNFIRTGLEQNSEHTEIVQWGIDRLKKIQTEASKTSLEELANKESFPYLSYTAKLKLNSI